MEDEALFKKQETEHTGEENTEDEEKEVSKKKGVENVVGKSKRYPKAASPQCSSSSYTTAEEDQAQCTPESFSSVKHDSLLYRYTKLEKMYEAKCKEAAALKNELDCVRDMSCIDASMGQLTSGVVPDVREQLVGYEKVVGEYRDAIVERDDMIKTLADALREKNVKDDFLEKENEKLLQKIKFLEQQLTRLSAYVQNTPSEEPNSAHTSKALMEEILQLKQELAHKDLLYQEACTKQFSLETDLRELEERARQQEIEVRAAMLHARRAQIKEETSQMATLVENIGCANDDEDSAHIHLWEEVMCAQEQAHQLIVEKLENQYREELTERENVVRLEMMEKLKEIEENHFKQISEISEQLQMKFDGSNLTVKNSIIQHLNVQHGQQQEASVSLENILAIMDGKEDFKQEVEAQVKALISHNVQIAVRTLEEQHSLNVKRQLANIELVQQQKFAALRSELEYEKQLQVSRTREELTKRHKEEINEMIRVMQSERSRLKFYVANGGSGMSILKKQLCVEYKAAFQGLVSSWFGEWKQEMASISSRLDALADAPQTSRDSDLSETLQLVGLEGTDSLLGEQERLLSEAIDISQRLIQHFKSSLNDIMKALELEHSRVTERIEEMRSELEEAGVAARLQALVDRLRSEKHELENSHKVALENMAARHETEVARLRLLVKDVQAGGEIDALKAQQQELEQKHQQEMEELRSYFEQKCADVGKHYSEEVYSQHSRKMSDSNCSSECELGPEIYYIGPGSSAGVGVASLCSTASGTDSFGQAQHAHESCSDHNCKERETRLIKEFHEQIESQRLSLESRYQGELETLKEEYEIRVKELVRDITRSHQAELASREAQLQDEKSCLSEKLAASESERSEAKRETETLKETIASLSEKVDEIQTKYEAALSEAEELREQLAKLEEVSCHEISREIETSTEEWIDSLEIITVPKDKAGVRWGKNVKSEGDQAEAEKEKDDEVASLELRLNAAKELENKCVKLEQRIEELEQRLSVSEDEKEYVTNEREKLSKKCFEMQEQNEHLRDECLDWEKKYGDLNKLSESLKLQLSSLNVDVEDTKRDLSLRSSELKSKTEMETALKMQLNEIKERLKVSEETQKNLLNQLDQLRSEKENFIVHARTELLQQLQEQHQAEIARLKKYYTELQNRTAEGQEAGSSSLSCEEKKLREDLNSAVHREKEIREECRRLDLSLQKKHAENERLSEALKRKETESTHQIALLKSKLRESQEIIAEYDKTHTREYAPSQESSRMRTVTQKQFSSGNTEAYLETLLSQLEAEYAEYFKLVQQCSDESQTDIAAKYVRALEQLQERHGEAVKVDLPGKESLLETDNRRASVCGGGHVGDGDGDGNSTSSLTVTTLDDLLMDKGALERLGEENVRMIRRISEELEAMHLSQLERLQATHKQRLEEALSAKDKEFERLESELRLEQEVQLREVQLEAERRWNLRLQEARDDIVRTLESNVQALLTDDLEDGERPLELQKLEEKLSAKYRRELELQKENHVTEIQKLKQQYDARMNRKGTKNAAALAERLSVITSERNCLRNVAATLRDLVVELVRYFVSCEDKLNTSLMEELALFGQDCSILRNSRYGDNTGDLSVQVEESPVREVGAIDESTSLVPVTPSLKRVRFADDLSGLVKCIDDESLLRFVDVSQDEASIEFQQEIDRCLDRLRSEAQTLLALSQRSISDTEKTESGTPQLRLAGEPAMEQKHADVSQSSPEKDRQETCEGSSEIVFEEFGDSEPVTYLHHASMSPRGKVLDELVKKARALLPDVSQTSLFLEELRRDWERLMEDSRRQEENLQQQVIAADKQLRRTRSFLEEQVAEREQERDEIQRLRQVVIEKDRERSSFGHMSKEMESLNAQLQDTVEALKEAEKKIMDLEGERDNTLDKIRMLEETVNDLEGQLLKKMQQEAALELRIKMLQKLTEQQGKTHLELVQELESLHKESDMTEHIRSLQDKLHQYEMIVEEGNLLQTLKEMRSQLNDMELLVECRTKKLEEKLASPSTSSPALSSPSEDVSIRETIEAMRNILREENEERRPGSVPALPLDAVSRLEEKMHRHVRAEEALMKKITDLDMQCGNIRSNLMDIQAERDHLSERLQEQLLQTSQLQVRLDEQRRKGDASQTQAVVGLKGQIAEAHAEIGTLREDLEARKRQCEALQKDLGNTQSALQKKEREVAQISESHQYLIEQLKIQIKKHLKEKEKLKEVFSTKMNASASLPLLVDSMLADKNADIDMLENQVAHFKSLSQVRSPYETSSQQSEYSATPSSTLEFEYRETEKVRAHVELAPILELQRSINFSELEPMPAASPTQEGKANSSLQDTLNAQSLPRLVSPHIQPKSVEPLVEPPLQEDSTINSSGVKGDETSVSVTSPGDQDDTSESVVKELKTTIANLTSDNNSLKDELSIKDSEVKQLTDQVSASQEILANLQTKLEEAREMAGRSMTQELAKENSELKERCVSIRVELEDNFKQRENELRSLLEAEQSATRAAHKDLEAVRQQLVETRSREEDHAILQQQLKSAEDENVRLRAEYEELKRQVASSDSKSLSEKLESEKEFSKALKEELNMSRVRITELERELEKLEEERAMKARESMSRVEELKRAQEQLEFLLGENARLDAELVALKAQRKQDQDDVARNEFLVQEIAHLRQENVEVGRELSELKKNLSKFRQGELLRTQEHKDLRHLLRDNNKLKKELASLRKAIEGVYGGDAGPLSPDTSAAGLSNEDKSLILSLRNKMDCLATKLDNPKREAVLARKQAILTRTAVMTNDFRPPGSPLTESESLEDLTGLVRKELNVSAHLDDTLLRSLQPLGAKDKMSQPCSSQTRDNADRSPIAACLPTVDYTDKKNAHLMQTLQQLKNSNFSLSSELSETRCAVQLLQNQLEIERSRYKTLQEQDSTLIEAMRIKLEEALDSEAQLRTTLESERRQRIEATNHKPMGSGDDVSKILQLHSERFHDVETCRLNVEKQTKFLETQLSKALRELEQRRASQDVLLEKAREAELRRSRKRAAEEEQHRNRLDHANMCQEELQRELEDTRRQLHQSRSLEADLRRELAEIRNSQLQDHRRILQELENMDKHVTEKKHLTDKIKLLLEEKSQLQMHINQLEEKLASHQGNDNWNEAARLSNERACWERERTALHAALTQATKRQCTHDSDFEDRVNFLFGKYLRCDSYRKALVWQKRYLLLVINSYHEARSRVVEHSNGEMPLPYPRILSSYSREPNSGRRRREETRPIERFRLAGLVVKATVRMRFMVQRWFRSRRIGSTVVLSKNLVLTPNENGSDISGWSGVRRRGSGGTSGETQSTTTGRSTAYPAARLGPVHRNTNLWSAEVSSADCLTRLQLVRQRLDAQLAQTPHL